MNKSPNILDKIVARKLQEVAHSKSTVAMLELEKSKYFDRQCYSFADFLRDPLKTGIIMEFKRASPSKGMINANSKVEDVVNDYSLAGASACSVLTDTDFFGGSAADLLNARAVSHIPLLRKDFIVDAYQVLESKAWGADIVLLIAAILTPQKIKELAFLAKSLGLNVLLEVHNKAELESNLHEHIDAIGVNNRNLSDFSVDIQTSFKLVDLIPKEFLKISESAISEPDTILSLKKAGFDGFLVGEHFMKTENPGLAAQAFVSALKNSAVNEG